MHDRDVERSPDAVCEKYSTSEPRVRIELLDNSTVLVEASQIGCFFLSDLFAALANSKDHGFQISPRGAGSRLFSAKVGKGLYLRRVTVARKDRGTKRKTRRAIRPR